MDSSTQTGSDLEGETEEPAARNNGQEPTRGANFYMGGINPKEVGCLKRNLSCKSLRGSNIDDSNRKYVLPHSNNDTETNTRGILDVLKKWKLDTSGPAVL